LGFYDSQSTIVAVYTHDGKPQVSYGAEALVAMNAVGATISTEDFAKRFVEDLWNQPTPRGQWRYYNGLLHMLGLLHVSGEFKIYGNPNLK
jgi:endo-1,4-beta-D-glucanase Y